MSDERIKRLAIKTGQLTPDLDALIKMLSVVENVRDETLLTLALDIGARREDIVKIEIANINFNDNSILYFEKKKGHNHKAYFEDKTKAVILKYLATRKDKKRFLFPTPYKNKQASISGRQAYNIYNYYLHKAGITPENKVLPFHTLRSACIKLKLRAGWNINEVARQVDDKEETIRAHYSIPSYSDMSRLIKEKKVFI